MLRRVRQVDVFTEVPLYGNPLAVVVDADGLTTDEMGRFANWTNLSETTFLLPPTDPAADYRVRIFTTAGPRRESPVRQRRRHRSRVRGRTHPDQGCRRWRCVCGPTAVAVG